MQQSKLMKCPEQEQLKYLITRPFGQRPQQKYHTASDVFLIN